MGLTVARMYSQLPLNAKRWPSKVSTWPSPYRVQVDVQRALCWHDHFPREQVLEKGSGSWVLEHLGHMHPVGP